MNGKTDSNSPVSSPKPLQVVLVTGLSGSGKSTAANALEDLGYYCVDNMPLPLLRTFLEDPVAQVGEEHRRIAVVTDVRAPGFAQTMPQLLKEVNQDNRYQLVILFLEASEHSLLRRFSETRRTHPLGEGDRPVIDGIRRETELLSPLRSAANFLFDTSDWSVHDVRSEIYREFAREQGGKAEMVVSLVSFGFKHGTPSGSDLMFDVRFLPNPYFRPGLREQTGRDEAVQEFLYEKPDFTELMGRLEDFLGFLLPRYQHENRSYVSLAIGCTGGRHRSVATCEHLNKHLGKKGWSVRLNHRDIHR